MCIEQAFAEFYFKDAQCAFNVQYFAQIIFQKITDAAYHAWEIIKLWVLVGLGVTNLKIKYAFQTTGLFRNLVMTSNGIMLSIWWGRGELTWAKIASQCL